MPNLISSPAANNVEREKLANDSHGAVGWLCYRSGAGCAVEQSRIAGSRMQLTDKTSEIRYYRVDVRRHDRKLVMEAAVLGPLEGHGEAQGHRVQRLDDPVVDVSPHPAPLLGEDQAFLVHALANVLDGQRDMIGEHGHRVQVVSLERRTPSATACRQDAYRPFPSPQWDDQRRAGDRV